MPEDYFPPNDDYGVQDDDVYDTDNWLTDFDDEDIDDSGD